MCRPIFGPLLKPMDLRAFYLSTRVDQSVAERSASDFNLVMSLGTRAAA